MFSVREQSWIKTWEKMLLYRTKEMDLNLNGDSFLPVSDQPLECEIYGDFLLWFLNMVE